MKQFSFKKIAEIILFTLVLSLAILLRISNVLHQNFAFTYDVGRDLLALNNIIITHKMGLIGFTTGLQGVFYGPWWYIFLLPAFVLSNGNPSGIIIYMNFIGVITVILGYLLGKKIGGSLLGFMLMIVFSISPLLIAYSSQIWNPNIAPFFVLSTIFILYLIYKKNSPWYFLLLGFITALNIEIEIVFGSIFFIYTTFFTFIYFYKRLNLKKIILYFLGLFLVLLPQLLFEFRHNFIMSKSFLNFLTGKSDAVSSSYNFISAFVIIRDLFSYTIFNNLALVSILSFVFIIILSIYFIFFLKDKSDLWLARKFLITFSFFYLIFSYILLSLFRHTIYDHYFIGEPVVFILLISLLIYELIINKNLIIKIFSILIFIVILILNTVSNNFVSIFNNYTGDASVYKNQIQVIDYIYKTASGKPFKYNVYTPPIFDYTYQYLFLWYGKNKYGYLPTQNSKLDFFIIEPDPGFPDRIQAWLSLRRNDGKMISNKKFPSGIIVQKRD